MRKATLMCIALGMALILCPVLASGADYPLYAGQTTLAGTITVSGSGSNLTVTFTTTGSWSLVETHLHVANSLGGLPQKNGNPIPGQFACKAKHDPPVTTYTYAAGSCPSPVGGTAYIAAHAVVAGGSVLGTTQVLSGQPAGLGILTPPVPVADTTVTLKRIPPAGSGPGMVQGAVQAEVVNPLWITDLRGKAERDLLIALGARWVWDSPRVGCGATPCDVNVPNSETLNGSVIRLQHQFSLPQAAWATGLLRITCDNGYVATLNGQVLGFSGVNPITLWNASDFLEETTVPSFGWQYVKAHPISAGLLLPGQVNLLTLDVANERMIAGDLNATGTAVAHPKDGTPYFNPGGCLYVLTVSASGSETAWGAGAGLQFPGKNWATYIVYP